MALRTSSLLSEQAYEKIRAKILTGALPLGSPLSRRKLADELGMSLIPVSEALQQLESEELVESKPRAGTRVKVPTGEDIRGRYIVREALESQSARLFAELATKAQRKRIRELAESVDQLSDAIVKSTPKKRPQASYRFEQEHLKFHMEVAVSSGCQPLVQAIERSRVLIFNWLFAVITDTESLPPHWHRDLARILTTGTPLEADEAMRTHVAYRKNEILTRLESMEDPEQKFARGPQRRVG